MYDNEDSQKYQDKFLTELKVYNKKQFAYSMLTSFPILLGFYFTRDNPEIIQKVFTPMNALLIFGIMFFGVYKFAPKLHCPRCNASFGKGFSGRGRFQKRCCGNCGLVLYPKAQLQDVNSPLMKQEIRPGFIYAIMVFGGVITTCGYAFENEAVKLAGVVVAGFAFMIKHLLPGTACKKCGHMTEKGLKFCEYCGNTN